MILISITRAELVAAGACEEGLRDFDELAALQGQVAGTWSFFWTPLFAVEFARGLYKRHIEWLYESGFIPRANLRSANLRSADLGGADLGGANLYVANL